MKLRFRMHPVGAVLWLAAFLFLPSRAALSAALALLWHEGWHLLMMRLCGAKSCSVEITPFGGMADVREYERLSPLRQALCAIAGVAGSAAGWLICLHADRGGELVSAMAQMNLSLALCNALPVWPLDGARVCVAVGAAWGCEHTVRKVLSILSVAAGVGMTALALYGAWIGHINLSLLFSGPYLCYAVREGYVSDRVRNLCGAETKLTAGEILPVRVYAGRFGKEPWGFSQMLGRFSRERYHLLLNVGENGVEQIWTEDDMRRCTMDTAEIGKRGE